MKSLYESDASVLDVIAHLEDLEMEAPTPSSFNNLPALLEAVIDRRREVAKIGAPEAVLERLRVYAAAVSAMLNGSTSG